MKNKLYIVLAVAVFCIAAALIIFKPWYKPEAYIEPEKNETVVTAGVTVNYPLGEDADTIFCGGRLYVPLETGARFLGAELNLSADSFAALSLNGTEERYTTEELKNVDGKNYISLYRLITPFDYELVVDLVNNSVTVLKDVPSVAAYTQPTADSKPAYIRLEDIMADGLKPDGTGKYTVDMLERLKYTAEYLYTRGQQYYIAWIPVYSCPQLNYTNDVSSEYNLYNAYFLYVMDYMVAHNGHLGLHGYTHQYGTDESADGVEWGSHTPYNLKEQCKRMRDAKDCARLLGYEEEFFEFPHYDATRKQLKIAEKYFDTIYQAYPKRVMFGYEKSDNIEYVTVGDRTVCYVPTPADYVYYNGDYTIFDRLKESMASGADISLFYHPSMDADSFDVQTTDGQRVWNYNENGFLPKIINYLINAGYTCSEW
jgi:hypothetical protein